jgi:eukaryotic-like serine/threonine-protein kinase
MDGLHIVAGNKLGPYVFERPLGVGAYGVVWLAHRHDSPTSKVAIKVLHPQAVSHESVERFRREARALEQLSSPYIAKMFEFVVGPPFGFALVMEYIQGELLASVFKRTKLGVEDSIHLGADLLRGVIEMHGRGIIHRDLKPANVMLRPIDGGWIAVVLDFNLSRFKDGTDENGRPQGNLTAMGSAIGTIPFMAPEQIVDARRANESADVYSVGAILYNAVVGAPAFDISTFRVKLTEEAPPVATGRTDPTAVGFADLVQRAMRRRPAERFASAQEMLVALEAIPLAPPSAR